MQKRGWHGMSAELRALLVRLVMYIERHQRRPALQSAEERFRLRVYARVLTQAKGFTITLS